MPKFIIRIILPLVNHNASVFDHCWSICLTACPLFPFHDILRESYLEHAFCMQRSSRFVCLNVLQIVELQMIQEMLVVVLYWNRNSNICCCDLKYIFSSSAQTACNGITRRQKFFSVGRWQRINSSFQFECITKTGLFIHYVQHSCKARKWKQIETRREMRI